MFRIFTRTVEEQLSVHHKRHPPITVSREQSIKDGDLSIYFIEDPQKIARLSLSFAIHLLLVCVGLRTLCTHARTLLLPRSRCNRDPAITITSSGIAGTEMKEAVSPILSLSSLSVVLRSAI